MNLHTIVRIGVSILVVAIVALVGTITLACLGGAANSYVVLSESMEPHLGPGDVVVVQSVPPSAIETGDVITYQTTDAGSERTRVTHRVVERRRTDGGISYRTRGDANDTPDPEMVDHDQVVGEVKFHIPYLGHLVLFAQRPLGLAALLVGPGLLLLGSGFSDLVTALSSETTDD